MQSPVYATASLAVKATAGLALTVKTGEATRQQLKLTPPALSYRGYAHLSASHQQSTDTLYLAKRSALASARPAPAGSGGRRGPAGSPGGGAGSVPEPGASRRRWAPRATPPPS